jgi:hypothetical protein
MILDEVWLYCATSNVIKHIKAYCNSKPGFTIAYFMHLLTTAINASLISFSTMEQSNMRSQLALWAELFYYKPL